MKQEKLSAGITGIVLFIIAALFSVSIVSGILGSGNEEGFLYSFGNFIVSVYGVCSILIPAFLFVAACFCFTEKWSVQKACVLFVSIIPFFTLVFAERICRKVSEVDFGVTLFIKIMVILIVAFLLVATEYLLAVILSGKFHEKLVNLDFPFAKKDSDGEKDSLSFEDESAEKEENVDLNDFDDKKEDFDSVGLLGEKRKEIEKAALDMEKEKELSRKYESIWSIDENGDVKDKVSDEEEINEEVFFDNEVQPLEEKLFEEKNDKEILTEEREEEVKDESEKVFDFSENKTFDSKKDFSEEKKFPGIINLSAPENLEVVDLHNLDSDKIEFEKTDDLEEDDIISQFERENLSMEENEGNPFEEENSSEEYKSEIPFEEFDEEKVPERKDTNVNRLMEKFDAITDSVEEELSGEEEIEAVEELENSSDEEFLAEVDTDVTVEDENDVKEPDLDFEDVFSIDTDSESDAESAENAEDEGGAQKKTPEIISAAEKPSGSMLSSLDSVFSKMDEDAKEQVEEYEVKGKTAVVTDADGNSTPIKVTPKIRHKTYKISTDLLTEYEENAYWEIDDETRHAASSLMATLKEFNIDANVTEIRKGPVVTMFEILPAPGVRLSKIQALQDNIALRLAAKSVRIVAPIPGKRAVGIEVPNKNRAIVSFRECIEQNRPEWKKMAVPVVLGKDIEGETQLMDLVKTPHLLIAGSTGAGKSVCVNSMILSILYKRSPDEVKMILIDPKIVELSLYNGIGHLLTPVITEPKMAMQALQYCLCEMERRYAVLKSLGCRDIASYNQKIKEQHLATEKLSYIVVVIDEFADLMATTGKQLEQSVARLAAKARAIGIHLVLATQRPSVDVITGLIKANIPSRIAFMVSSKMDSRIIIDQMGADKLLGKGDMLYASSTDPFPIRIQGAFVSDQEVENVVNEVKNIWGEPEYIDEEIFVDDEDDGSDGQMSLFGEGEDPLYEKALDVVIQAGKASASYIQRRLSIGYNRAARLVEEMEERGIVGPANGSKPREIIHMP